MQHLLSFHMGLFSIFNNTKVNYCNSLYPKARFVIVYCCFLYINKQDMHILPEM